eukprot:g2109.t1
MVALLPVALALGLACTRRDLARHGAPATDSSTPGSTSASPVKARDTNISGVSPGEGSAFDWFVRGGGKHGASLATAEGAGSQSVSLFGPEEKELDRYSAALAGTHFLRQERDRVIKDTTNPLAYMYLSMTKPGQHNRWMSSPWISNKARQAQKSYLLQAGNIIRSNGLSTNRYNELSHIMGKRKDLRERVQHQAYLYRVNADLRGDKIHPLVDLSETTPRSDRRQSEGQQMVKEENKPRTGPPDKKMLFAKSLREIESLRHRQRRRLMTEMGCDDLPKGLCRPSIGRIASPRIRKECQRFPIVAESIVKANGLKLEEFNRLSARSRGNLFYRWQVLRCVRKLEKRGGG